MYIYKDLVIFITILNESSLAGLFKLFAVLIVITYGF